MKTKFSRILGVALTIAMVASLFVFAIPAAAEAGNTTWVAQTIPTATNQVIVNASDVGDIAVSSDGTIYVINNDDGVAAAAAGAVLSSTDGGNSFSPLAAVAGAVGFMSAIAVAPDNSDAVAVTDGAGVFVSNNGGTTWTGLPPINTVGDEIMDIDVSPAIAGGIVSRHYVIAVADPVAGGITGAAEIYGPGATWTVIAIVPAGDYMACKFSPSYVGDRGLALVWNAGGLVTNLSIVTQPGEAAEALTRTSAIGTASADYDDTAGGTLINSQVACDIALPSDWDTSLSSGEVTFVSVASTAAAVGIPVAVAAGRGGLISTVTGTLTDDVYRIDAGVAVDLNGSNTVPVHSIAYDGTIDDGTLFLGTRLLPSVRYTLNPTSMSPTWKTTQKAPTGDNIAFPEACTKVVVAPNGDIYAGTRDSWNDASFAANRRSAFSVSTDAAVSFNQTALIDVGAANLVLLDDIMPAPDGETVFLSSDDGTDLSLWKSSVSTGAATWERIYCRAASAGPSIIRLAPDFADNPSIFWADTTGAVAPNGQLWVSHDGGAIFSNRTPPALIVDLAVESGGSSGVLYMSNAGNIYKSTNGGYFFGLAVPSELVGAVTSLSMAPMYPEMPVAGNLIVGGNSEASYSTDAAASFTLIDGGLGTAGNCVVGADEAYATNNTIYAAGVGDGEVYRFVIGTSVDWTDLAPGATNLQGIALSNGALYAADTGAGATDGVHRTLIPDAPAGVITWEVMNDGAGAAATFNLTPNSLRVVDNVLWAIDTAVAVNNQLLAYDDWLATTVLVPTAPADGFAVPVDPVNGRAEVVGFAWQTLGAGNGLVDDVEIQIAPQGTNFGSPLIRSYSSVATATGLANTVGLDPTNPVLLVGTTGQWVQNLKANTIYEWRLRVRDTVAGDTIRSPWSESRVLNIQAGGAVVAPQVGPILQGPIPGATGVSLNPGFTWAPISGATEYEFILATNATLTDTVEGTPVLVTQPSWQVPAGTLEYGTDYFWGVKSTQPTESPQSIGTFRTMISELYECPFCSETFTTAGALESHIAAMHPAATPAYIWAIIVIGAILMIAVIMLIIKTRRVA